MSAPLACSISLVFPLTLAILTLAVLQHKSRRFLLGRQMRCALTLFLARSLFSETPTLAAFDKFISGRRSRSFLSPPVSVFAVAVSAEVIAGKQETLCAHIQGATEPVNLTIALERGTEKTTLLEEAVTESFHRCLNFQV